MINRNPYDRDDLKITKKDRVLEVGSGHNPTFRADVIVERFLESNYHRCGTVKGLPAPRAHQCKWRSIAIQGQGV